MLNIIVVEDDEFGRSIRVIKHFIGHVKNPILKSTKANQ